MTEVASSVVNQVLGTSAHDVDKPIVDYVINVLADEDFDFGADGEGVFEALGELLVDSGWVPDFADCRSVILFTSPIQSRCFLYEHFTGKMTDFFFFLRLRNF